MKTSEATPLRLADERPWRRSVFGLLLLSALVAAGGDPRLPPDGHEAYVLQTAREMRARGDWLVPYFNGAPRLTKPPLSYWLTALSARLSGGGEALAPWHGRLPSVLAALGTVALTLSIGAQLFDRPTALLAGVLLASSAGYYSYAHDARPDMLYAFWCTAAFAAFLKAYLASRHGAPSGRPALLMWLCLAGATLTKGPQVPAMLLLAAFVLCRPVGLLRTLHLGKGLPLLACLTVPWWWLLHERLGAGGLAGTQLAGTLLSLHPGRLGDPYYLLGLLQLLLPWVVLVPAALLLPLRHSPRARTARLLAMPVAVGLIGFSLGPQYRWFYLLPFLPQACLLLAAAALPPEGTGWPLRRARTVLFLHALPVAGLLSAWALGGADLPAGARVAALASAALAAGLAFAGWRLRTAHPLPLFALLALVAASVYANPAFSPLLWSRERFARAQLAETAARAAAPRTPLVLLGLNPDLYAYYLASRPVILIAHPAELLPLVQRSEGGEVILVALTSALPALPAGLAGEVLAEMPGKASLAAQVLRLRAVGAAPAVHD